MKFTSVMVDAQRLIIPVFFLNNSLALLILKAFEK